MSKYKELAKNTGIFAIANFSSKILIFILVPIYTRALSTADYGYYDLVYSTIQLLLPILTLNVSESVMRFLLMKDAKPTEIFTVGMRSTLVGSVVMGIGLILNYILSISELTSYYSLYIWFFFVFYALNNILVQFAKGIDRVSDMALASVIGTLSMVIFNILFLIVFNLGLTGFFIANITCYLLPTLYLIVRLRLWQYLSKEIDPNLEREMYLFSVPLILNTLGWWVNNTSDRYIVTAISGVGANGLISVAYKIPQILSTVSTIFIQAWQISAIKEKENNNDNSFTSNLFFDYSGVLAIIASVLIILVKPLAALMFGNDFFVAWKFVPFLIISSLLNAAAGYIGASLSANMKTKAMAKSAVYGMVTNIILNIVLALLIGPQGIAIATMISSYVIFEIRRKNMQNAINKRENLAVQITWLILVFESYFVIYTNFWYINILSIIICAIYFNRFIMLLKKLFFVIKSRKK